MSKDKVILGFETSCDETAIAIMRGEELLVNTISSQVDIHEKFGGVVPEVASRAHAEMIRNIFHSSLNSANLQISDIDSVATTDGPGLVGSLVVGYNFAKSIAWSIDKPLYTVDHMVGHLAAPLIENPNMEPPFLTLLVSGGHTQIVLVEKWGDYKLMGTTIDDAAGEAFDKVARIMGLGFPGGPVIDSEAKNGKADEIIFPRGLSQNFDIQKHRYDFSFSGLKTAVLRYLEQTPNYKKADVAASFQEAVVDVLLTKSLAACQESGIDNLVIAGGVAANSRLRQLAIARCQAAKVELSIPPANLCTDNGAMVAALGSLAINEGLAPSQLGISADSAAEISRVIF